MATRGGSGLKIEIKKYRAAGYWQFDVNELGAIKKDGQSSSSGAMPSYMNKADEEDEAQCGICHAPLDNTCPACTIPGDDCPPVMGECSHIFHFHCIIKWTSPDARNPDDRRDHCPMCRAKWKFKGQSDD